MERSSGSIAFANPGTQLSTAVLESKPSVTTAATPAETAVSTRNNLLRISSTNPGQYAPYLEALSKAPQVSGVTIVNAARHIGDTGEIEVITDPLPSHMENLTRPFGRGGEFFLRRPELHELIYVGPKNRTKNTEPQLKQPNSSPPETNPFLSAPALLKKAT